MIVTVTLNAAIDRTLTVPNFQRGQRHRASAGVTLAGGKGINVARALKALGVPVVATGLVGGSTGSRDRRSADARGDPQRLRPHRRRVAHVDRGRRSDRRHVHRDQRVGAGGHHRGARHAAREASLPDAGRRARRVRRLAAARRRRRLLCRGDARAREAARLDRARHRRRAAAARRRGGAVPRLAEPGRGGGARRPGVPRRGGLPARARRHRRARRTQRADHDRAGRGRAACARTARRTATGRARRASTPSRSSAQATCCSPASSPRATQDARTRKRCAPPSPRAPRRRSRSAPAASTRGTPAGCRPGVELAELAAVEA